MILLFFGGGGGGGGGGPRHRDEGGGGTFANCGPLIHAVVSYLFVSSEIIR